MSVSKKYRKLIGPFLLHYTPEENVGSIIDSDKILYSKSELDKNEISPLHMTDEDSLYQDYIRGNNQYVFLVFLPTHPLIYKKRMEGYNLREIHIDVSILDLPGVLITDRVATDNSVQKYTPSKALKKLKIEHCHGGRVDREIWDEVKKYEIMIPHHIDLKQYFCNS